MNEVDENLPTCFDKACSDPVKPCSGINLRGLTNGYVDGRRDQAVDSAT
jgi:hypothetical protein